MSFERLIGSWELCSCTIRDTHGAVSCPYGSHPQGVILYTAAGWMSCHMASGGAVDGADVAGTIKYTSYHGPFTIAPDEGYVTHHVRGSSIDQLVGTDQVRFYAFDGDLLILSASMDGSGVEVTWRAIPPVAGIIRI
jgi:hypothetical protein